MDSYFVNVAIAADSDAAKAAAVAEASSFVAKLNEEIFFPTIFLLSGIAFLYFVYGAAVYILNAGSEQAQEQGKKHITYSLLGLFVMASAYALLNLAAGTFGLGGELKCATNPDGTCVGAEFTLPE